jgi:hypothetical protein
LQLLKLATHRNTQQIQLLMFWYEDEVNRVVQELKNCRDEPKTVFYGSSSIRLWETLYEDFKPYQPVNLGFGGSTLAACVWFFERIMAPLQHPRSIIIYAGDNDLGDGRHPEEVFIFYQQLVQKLKQHFSKTSCYFISIKPSISRWHLNEQIKFTNGLIEKDITQQNSNFHFINVYDQMLDENGYPDSIYFEADGLHLSKHGYQLWKSNIFMKCSF